MEGLRIMLTSAIGDRHRVKVSDDGASSGFGGRHGRSHAFLMMGEYLHITPSSSARRPGRSPTWPGRLLVPRTSAPRGRHGATVRAKRSPRRSISPMRPSTWSSPTTCSHRIHKTPHLAPRERLRRVSSFDARRSSRHHRLRQGPSQPPAAEGRAGRHRGSGNGNIVRALWTGPWPLPLPTGSGTSHPLADI